MLYEKENHEKNEIEFIIMNDKKKWSTKKSNLVVKINEMKKYFFSR